jgi:hypothetical protein
MSRRLVWALALLASSFVANAAPDLDGAIGVFNAGQFDQAHAFLARIIDDNPKDIQARYYDALCLRRTDKPLDYARAAEALKVVPGELSGSQLETIDYEYIRTLYQLRRFAQAEVHARDFLTSHTLSPLAPRMRTVQLLATYEVGYKKTWDAKNTRFMRDDESVERNWI